MLRWTSSEPGFAVDMLSSSLAAGKHVSKFTPLLAIDQGPQEHGWLGLPA
jgi:hypothetical protein